MFLTVPCCVDGRGLGANCSDVNEQRFLVWLLVKPRTASVCTGAIQAQSTLPVACMLSHKGRLETVGLFVMLAKSIMSIYV